MQTPSNLLPEYSEKFDIVLTQLMKAKSEMGSAVTKDSSNPFHKSKYASLGAHLDLSEGVLFRHGLLMLHAPNMINEQHVLVATLHHPESGQWIKAYLPLPNPKGDSQGVGASITYMRRYSINSILGLNAEDDDGETASGRGKYSKKEDDINKTTVNQQPASQAVKAQVNQPQPQNQNQAKIQSPSNGKINIEQLKTLKELESKLDKECKSKLYSWMHSAYKVEKLEDVLMENYAKVHSGFVNAVKYIQDQVKQNKIEKLQVAHA